MNSGFQWRTMGRRAPGALGALAVWLCLAPGIVEAQPALARAVPSSVRAPLGSTFELCIDPDPGPAAAYQWRKNGVALPGQTNRCLSVTNVALSDGASYRAAVSDGTGAIESEESIVQILVSGPAGADSFFSRTLITAVSNSVRGTTFSSTREPSEPAHARLSTSNSVWYTWRAPASGIVTFDTRGSTYDTVLAVYTGSDLPGVRELVADDDGGGFHTSRVSWYATANVEYHVAIDGVTGETGYYLCNWRLDPTTDPLPVITLAPRSQSVPAGSTAAFDAAVTDATGDLRFQWYLNGQLLPGATKSNLTVANVQTANLGRYQLAVTNAAGRVALTPPVDLEIGPHPSVVSRDKVAEFAVGAGGGGGGGGGGEGEGEGEALFAASSVSAGTFSLAAGTTINQRFFAGGTTDRCEPAHCGVAGGASRWFQLAAAADGICTIDTFGSDVNTVLAVYLQNFSICTNLYEPLVECNNDVLGSCDVLVATNGVRELGSRVSFFATAGSVYRAVVDTVGGVRGTNIHFNVRFVAAQPPAVGALGAGVATNCVLQVRGGSLTLRLADALIPPGSTIQWFLNGRRVAGAGRSQLLLPALEYSDAGIYSAVVQTGTARVTLPGTTVLVLDPCRDDAEAGRPVRLVGVSPEALVLEARSGLATTSGWHTIGPIPRSKEPVVWEAGGGRDGFYRVVRPAP